MRIYYNILSLICVLINFDIIAAKIQDDLALNTLNGIDNPIKFLDRDVYTIFNKYNSGGGEKLVVKIYYETLCLDCMMFYKYQFAPTVLKMNQYLQIFTFPYGNAQIIVDHGRVTFKCQHGPAECYGNKLHACAIDCLRNTTAAVIFNSCMLDPDHHGGSDDAAADRCALELNLDSKPIKDCAKGSRGTRLLIYYGEKSREANFKYVPYILVNNSVKNETNFMKDVCDEFTVPPPECKEYY